VDLAGTVLTLLLLASLSWLGLTALVLIRGRWWHQNPKADA
jgi:hypothetical protein